MRHGQSIKRIWFVIAGMLIAAFFLMIFCTFYVLLFGPSKNPPTEAGITRLRSWRVLKECDSFFKRNGRWPTDLQELARWSTNNIETNDGWGHPLILQPFNPTLGYGSLVSYGADGEAGGRGTNSDSQYLFP